MPNQLQNTAESAFKQFIIGENHPCIMAQTVFQMESYQLKQYDDMLSESTAEAILSDIENYLDNYDFGSNKFESLIFCFTKNNFQDEVAFEQALWKFLQRLHDGDDKAWDSEVSNDPDDPSFSLSLKGRAFYVIGMHPKSSRIARRSPHCTVVLNLHWQFEKLREMGTYQAVKSRIRNRDADLQGFINPVLDDFGHKSETRQYSGRNVESAWKCPFHHKS